MCIIATMCDHVKHGSVNNRWKPYTLGITSRVSWCDDTTHSDPRATCVHTTQQAYFPPTCLGPQQPADMGTPSSQWLYSKVCQQTTLYITPVSPQLTRQGRNQEATVPGLPSTPDRPNALTCSPDVPALTTCISSGEAGGSCQELPP